MLKRCAVVSSESGCAVARRLIDDVARCPDLQVRPLAMRMPLPPASLDCAVLVVTADDVPAVADWLAERAAAAGAARCPVLAAGVDLRVPQLDSILSGGADDFLVLPVSPTELEVRLRRAMASTGRIDVADTPYAQLRNVVGVSAAFRAQVSKLQTYAACDAGVLITGETGTGKEVCAQAIHYLSARASGPWVAVNCAAIPQELVESELFGHVRGAFTHAQTARQGLVREAEGGTLFLDDIDCLPLAAQAKLLRFLQEGEYRQVGANTVHRADVRVIASSNRRPSDLAGGSGFRTDLYYRLAVLTLSLPPLRERREDIAALSLHFLRDAGLRRGSRSAGLSSQALARLMAHDWPGNVRELRHVLERACVLARGSLIEAADIDFGQEAACTHAIGEHCTFREAKARLVEDFERGFIENLLASHHGNVTQAALAAQKNRRAFFELMRKHHIDPARFRSSEGGIVTPA